MDKVVKVMQIIPELALAGAEIMVENLTEKLFENGYDVSVVSLFSYHSPITERLENKKIPVFYLDKKQGFDIKVIFRLYKLFKQERPDIIHTHRYIMPYAMIAAILSKVPVKIHTIHNVAEYETGARQRKINKLFYKYFNIVPISISPIVKRTVEREYKLSSNQVPMIYNGIDLSKCIPKKDYKVQDNKLRILHIGRFSEQKNHIGLIESFKVVNDLAPNTELKLIGTGKLENQIKDKVKELGLENSVEFLGLKSDVYTYLHQADIFVLPSHWEGMPITLIEALSSGLPIVASNVGGIPDIIIDNKTGVIVDVNKKEIAEGILKLVNSSELREKLGRAALKDSIRFSSTNMTNQYLDIYRKSLGIKKV